MSEAARRPRPRASSLILEEDPRLLRGLNLAASGCVAASLLVLSLSGEFPLPLMLGVLAALLASLFWGRSDVVSRNRRLVNGFLVAAMLLFGTLAFSTGNYLYHAVLFVALVQVVKLFQRTEPTDVLQVIALSQLGLIVGAIANPDLIFALAFLLNIVLMTWALILLHFYRDACRQTDQAMSIGLDPRPVIRGLRRKLSGRFLAATALLSFLVFLCTAAIFLLFPRMGLGFLFGGAGIRPVSGFSDRIELGHFGTLESDPAIVARILVRGAAGGPPPFKLYLRGRSLDLYEEGRWIKTYSPRIPVAGVHRGWVELPLVRYGHLGPATREARIFLEPLRSDTPVLPVPPGARLLNLAASGDRTGLSRAVGVVEDVDGDLVHDAAAGLRLVYDVRFDPGGIAASAPVRRSETRLLAVPEALRGRLRRFAMDWSAGATRPALRATRIERALRRELRYTLEGAGAGAPGGGDPVMHFLEVRREGHCEYFASAMVLLLRSLGIPARVVNGFAGGQWNRPAGFFLVRQQDAHAWVEAWIEGRGWRRYDPTPRSFDVEPGGIFAGILSWFQAAKLRWMSWVVTYNADKQIALFHGARRAWKGLRKKIGGLGAAATTGLGAATMALLLVCVLWWWRRRRPLPGGRRRRAPGNQTRLLRRIERALAPRFRERHPGEPPATWIRRAALSLGGSTPELATALESLSHGLSRLLYDPTAGASAARPLRPDLQRNLSLLGRLPKRERPRASPYTPPPVI